MALQAHLAELQNKHQTLEQTLHQELKHPSTDPNRITELKKQKLRLKEEISRIEARLG